MKKTERKNKLRGLPALLLCAAMLFTAAPAAFAENGEEQESVLDAEELQMLVEEFAEENHIDPGCFSVGYVYTATGESWYYNEDEWYDSASLYKVPLMMLIENQVARGNIDPEGKVCGVNLHEAEYLILVRSQNQVAEYLLDYFDSYKEFRRQSAELADFSEDMLPRNYLSSRLVSAEYMTNILKKLYETPEDYPQVTENLLLAQPEKYFRHYLEGEYDIAQKYGSYEGRNHTAGIIYTPNPILLTVLTYGVSAAEETIGALAERIVEYTLSLDQRLERQRAEKQAAEEAARLAEEEARQREEEARQAEEAARLAEEKAALETQRLEQEQTEKKLMVISAVAGAAVLLAAGVSAALVARKKRKSGN